MFLKKVPIFASQNLKFDNCDFQANPKDMETKNVNIRAGTQFK